MDNGQKNEIVHAIDRTTAAVKSGGGGGGGGAITNDGTFATPAAQITGNSSLSSIDSKTPTLGQKNSANSSPVVIASDQGNLPTTIASALPAGTNTIGNVILTSSATAASAGIKATMTAYGYQRMTLEPKLVFSDPFDGVVVDVTNNWNQTGTVTQSGSLVQVGNVVTTNTVNSLVSKPTFPPTGLNFLVNAFVASFETNPLTTTNVNRFAGFGIHTGTPTVSVPVTDGVGFEWDSATSKLYAAVWQNGVRSASSIDLTASVSSAFTRYAVLFRSDLAIFYIGGTEIPVATISFITPNTQILPIRLQTVIGASAPSTTPLMQIGAVAVGDTGGNATQLSDGTYPFRKATIDATGALKMTAAGIPTSLGAQSATTSQPVVLSLETSTGTITTQNLVPGGVATAGSAVEIVLNGSNGLSIQTTGTYTGALSLQVTLDGTNWVTVGGTPILNLNTGGLLGSITSALQSTFQTEVSGFLRARITALAAVTGTATVTLRSVATGAMVAIDSSLPTGTNSIGNIGTVATVTTLTGTTTLTPGTGATNLGKAEDAVHASGDTGIASLGVRTDTLLVGTSANGDYGYMALDNYNALITRKQGTLKRTYSTAFKVAVVSAATDIVEIIGSATTSVEIVSFTVKGSATAASALELALIKKSSAATGGTSTNQTIGTHNSTDVAATAVVKAYTANPTPGATVANIEYTSLNVGASPVSGEKIIYKYGENEKTIVLTGVAQTYVLSGLGGTIPAGTNLFIEIKFTEI